MQLQQVVFPQRNRAFRVKTKATGPAPTFLGVLCMTLQTDAEQVAVTYSFGGMFLWPSAGTRSLSQPSEDQCRLLPFPRGGSFLKTYSIAKSTNANIRNQATAICCDRVS